MDASAWPNNALAAVLYLSVGTSGAANGVYTPQSTQSVESMSDGVASASVTKAVKLTQGSIYYFGAIIESSLGTPLLKSSCHGTVLIVRQ
jgi:hypothetical protein